MGINSPVVVQVPGVASEWEADSGPDELRAVLDAGRPLDSLGDPEGATASLARTDNAGALVRHQGEGWRVARLSANRWELHREDEGWRATRRVNRLLDGGADGRELLGGVGDGSDRGGK